MHNGIDRLFISYNSILSYLLYFIHYYMHVFKYDGYISFSEYSFIVILPAY